MSRLPLILAAATLAVLPLPAAAQTGTTPAATAPADEVADSASRVEKDLVQPYKENEQASPVKTPTSYMVMIETPDTRAATDALVDQLRDAGESDFFVYRKRGRISLGVFKTLAAAEKRQRDIESLGFTVSTLERYQ